MSPPEELTHLNVRDLVDLMDSNLDTFHQKLQNFGGLDGLCTIIQNGNKEISPYQTPNPNPTDGVPRLTTLVWSGFKSRELRLLRIQFYLQMTPYLISHLFQFLLGFGVEREDEYYGHAEVSIWVKVQTALTYLLICLPLGVSAFLHGWTNYKVMSTFMGGVLNARSLTVIRDGATHENFLKSDLVIGDVCLLSPGSVSPADGVWMEGLIQPDVDPRVYCDQVIRGVGGKMIILTVGENTVMGRSAALANVDAIQLDGAGTPISKTILGDKLHSFSTLAIKIGFSFAILTTAFIFVRFCVEKYMIEKQVWAMAHAQRFVAFIVTGVLMFSRTLPDLVPLVLVISLAVTRHRLTRGGGVFLKNMDILTMFTSATTLLIEKECIDKTTSTPSDVAKAIKSCRRAAMVVRVLVPSPSNGSDSDWNFPKSFGFSGDDYISVVNTRACSSKAGIIRSLTDSGEIVALVSSGEDPQALQVAHVGIVMNEHGLQENGRPYIGPCDVHICAKNEFHVLGSLLGRGRRVYEDLNCVLQFYIPAIAILCLAEFFEKCIFVLEGSALTESRIRCITAFVFCIILGYILSPDPKVQPQLSALEPSQLNLTTKLMKKNIVGQILYQVAAVVVLLLLSTIDKPPDSSGVFLVNGIVWMTRYNALNGRKGHGEMNVLEGLSLTHPFLWIWINCAICHVGGVAYVDLTSDWFPLTRDEWFIGWAVGVGSLICYQVCRLIPIGRAEDVKARPAELNIPCSSAGALQQFTAV